MKIKFNTDNNLLLNKPLKLHLLTIIVRCIFEEDIKFYLQLYLDDCLYDLKTMIQLDRIEDSQGIDLNRTDKSKECKICYYNYFKNGFKSDSKVCNDGDWGIKSVGNFAIMHVNGFGYRFLMFDMTKEDVIEFIKDIEPNDEFETINVNKSSLSRKCMICHYWCFKNLDFYFKPNIFNKCLFYDVETFGAKIFLWDSNSFHK